MKTRFAPSPTGYLHIGNARTALIAYLYAKKANGEFVLRIDDTDTDRSEEKYVDGIKRDLEWLGIEYSAIYRQSERMDLYISTSEKLKQSGRLYPCYETADELEMKRKLQLSRGLPPIYDRESLKLTSEQIAKFEAEGRTPHWRFKLEDKINAWDDEIRGVQSFESKHTSDPILIRENGMFTYMLPSAIDDADMDMTHILRGEDHVSNTAVQLQLFEAIGGSIPNFAHVALVKSRTGKISKRKGGNSIYELAESGINPAALRSFLALIGTNKPVELVESFDDLISRFDIKNFSRATTQYSIEEVERLNTKLLHNLPFDTVKDELEKIGLNKIDEDFWLAVRTNINNINDTKDWWNICREDLVGNNIDNQADLDFVSDAAKLLPTSEFDSQTWNLWISEIKETTDRKGKQLFMPIRKALTGMEHGPELAVILPLIGRDVVLKRLG